MLIYADLSVFPISLRRNIPILHCKINIKQINIAMKKLLLLFAVLLSTVSGWAQESTKVVTFEVKGTTGVFGKTGNYSNAWGSSVTEENPYQLVLRTSGNNNININKELEYVLINSGDNSGTGTGCEYFIEVPAHCTITGYSFKCSFGSDEHLQEQ